MADRDTRDAPTKGATAGADRYSGLLLDVASAANGTRDPEEFLEYVVERLGELPDWPLVRLSWTEGDEPARPRMWADDEARAERFRQRAEDTRSLRETLEAGDATPLIADLDWPDDEDLKTAILVPIASGDRTVGLLEIYSRRACRAADPLIAMLRDVAVQVGHVAARLALERQVADLAERQQRRFGEELHDGLGQYLTGIRLLADGLRSRLREDASPHAPTADRLIEVVDAARAECRALIDEVMPAPVAADRFGDSLRDLARRVEHLYGVPVNVRLDDELAPPDPFTATQLYRIAQEAVHNGVKHSEPTEVHVGLYRADGNAVLRVHHDGFPGGTLDTGRGLGLRLMRHRARLLGAELEFRPEPDGLTVRCVAPI